MTGRWCLLTPGGTSGAIAIIQIESSAIDMVLETLHLGDVGVGRVVLRDLLGVDRGVVMRISETCVQLMPHGGKAVVEAICEGLASAGLTRADAGDVMAIYPEAGSLVEARMLDVLSRAHSPRAIDLLLDQPRRWAPEGATSDPGLDRVRGRLVCPPMVVAMGPANIGKSTLLNALADRRVAIVSDEPGTTRDHVGVMLDLDGLTVRYVDTPGVRGGGGAVEREAQELAGQVLERADLVLACGDSGGEPIGVDGGRASLVVALRADLGAGGFEADARVSAMTGDGLDALGVQIRRALVADEALEDPSAWRFWEE